MATVIMVSISVKPRAGRGRRWVMGISWCSASGIAGGGAARGARADSADDVDHVVDGAAARVEEGQCSGRCARSLQRIEEIEATFAATLTRSAAGRTTS